MGVTKPLEEDALGTAPRPSADQDLGAWMRHLVRPSAEGVEIAGRVLRIPSATERASVVVDLQRMLTDRMEARRPHADEATRARFETVVQGIISAETTFDVGLERMLIKAIDGL